MTANRVRYCETDNTTVLPFNDNKMREKWNKTFSHFKLKQNKKILSHIGSIMGFADGLNFPVLLKASCTLAIGRQKIASQSDATKKIEKFLFTKYAARRDFWAKIASLRDFASKNHVAERFRVQKIASVHDTLSTASSNEVTAHTRSSGQGFFTAPTRSSMRSHFDSQNLATIKDF